MSPAKKKRLIVKPKKVMDDRFEISTKKGNGQIKIEVWEYSDGTHDYSFAYVNHAICAEDNGRVLGYDKKRREGTHGDPHRHQMGERQPTADLPMTEVLDAFEREWKEIHNENNRNR